MQPFQGGSLEWPVDVTGYISLSLVAHSARFEVSPNTKTLVASTMVVSHFPAVAGSGVEEVLFAGFVML